MILKGSTVSMLIWYAGTAIYSVMFILSGILKACNPSFIIRTTQLLFNKLFGWNVSWELLLFIVGILIIWEIILGILLLLPIMRTIILSVFCSTLIFFILVSHYLNHHDLLASCGCFGPMSKFFYSIHFVLLYSGVIFSLTGLKRQKRKR